MTALATPATPRAGQYRRRAELGDRRDVGGERLFEPGGTTLEQLITATWDDLAAKVDASCPVCGEGLAPPGRCAACGSELT